MSEIRMIKEDVSMEIIDDEVCDSQTEECTFTITHRVWIDLRAGGGMLSVGTYCETCAKNVMRRIQDSLPVDDSPNKGGTK